MEATKLHFGGCPIRVLRSSCAAVIGLASLSTLGGAVSAQERLVMPFACSVRSAEVRLSPSPPQSYRIYGNREHQIYTACSPANPNRCRNWNLYRFDLDCDGVKVPWLRVVATASSSERYRGRVWVSEGRLNVRMGRFWAPGADRFRPPRWWYEGGPPGDAGPYDDDEDDVGRPPRPGPDVVEMPPGFAPTLGLPIEFVAAPPEQDAPAPVAAEPRGGFDAAEVRKPVDPAEEPRPSGMAEARKLSDAVEPRKPQVGADTRQSPEPPKSPATTIAQGEPPRVASPKVEPVKPEPPAPAKEQKQAPVREAPLAQGTNAAPRIINGPQEAKRPADTQARGSDDAAKPQQEKADSAPVSEAPEEKKAPEVTVTAELAPEKGEHSPPGTNITSPSLETGGLTKLERSIESPTPQVLMVIAALLLSGTAFLIVLRRRERARVAALLNRDPSSVSFDGGVAASKPAADGALGVSFQAPSAHGTDSPSRQEPPPNHGRAATGRPEAPRRPVNFRDLLPDPANQEPVGEATAQHTNGSGGDVLADSDITPLPTTSSEAFQVLGVSPDASPSAIKKVVDGLRKSWHPDHARTETDRLLREHRLKQINVAWDIISGRQSSAA
jgi:hypothetical protein